ncbi:MAG: hypothetical protein JWN43_2046 [Gammaproteobacteria bacterium]|nr:hypothetical protein [Gammaproteobacteria bacterium]
MAAASFVAGFQNALAGGGSFLTLPALLLTGLDSRAANIASTIALFPAQVATGFVGRSHAGGMHSLRFSNLLVVSLIGGAVGAFILLRTPPKVFTSLLPWLVLFTTLIFAWGNFFRRPESPPKRLEPAVAGIMQFAISVYGGYFGGGIGILMLAVLTLSGLALRKAAATKNVLAGVINSTAVAIFAFSNEVAWRQVAVVAVAAIAGGQLGAYALNRVNDRAMGICIVLMGFALTIGLFVRYHSA